jgi:acyl-homoserine lactone acylase PvdQ
VFGSALRRTCLQLGGSATKAVLVGALTCCLLLTGSPSARAQVQAYGTNDYGGFRDVLPPGANGFANLGQLIAWELLGIRPPHNGDQITMYANLTTATPNIQPAQIGQYFKDATFGVRAGDLASSENPEPGVTIERDGQFGVPHIYGDTRADLMFGIGWATAEDRLFFIDALRHAGRGELAQFAGGSNVAMDEMVWANEPYTEQDLTAQVQYGVTHLPDGAQIGSDATNFVAGINAYIALAKKNPFTMMPAEYFALGKFNGPEPFTVEDVVAIAALVGGIFGNGGGHQLQNAVLYQDLKQRFGPERQLVAGSPEQPQRSAIPGGPDLSGFGTFLSFDAPNDPEAPTTVHGRSFPYQTLPPPSRLNRASIALPDPNSVQWTNHVVAGGPPPSGSTSAAAAARVARAKRGNRYTDARFGAALGRRANAGPGLLAFPPQMSNALLVSGAHTVSGHPIAVMGPQTSYFSPEILEEEDIHGPGIDAAGAAFAGANMYVELGHGRDYAWSATSAGQNITDTFAVPLCNPAGGAVSTQSDYYLLRGRCVQMETLTRSESWTPNLGDFTPAGSITLQTQRTALGLVISRATIHGRPVAYCNLRSTYMHELDSSVGFERFNNPDAIRSAQDFFNAAYNVGYTFNWFYADDQHIAYFNAGLNPVRPPGTDPLFPTWSRYPWVGYTGAAQTTPTSLTEQQTPQSAHPQTIDQGYLTSWNNKQAPDYQDPATGQQFASVFRSQLLDQNIDHYLTLGHGKMTLTDLINAMGNAGTQDLRGVEVLPYALQIMGTPTDPALAQAVAALRTWAATGAHRINRLQPGASGDYEQADAVRIMDAWWPLLVRAEFGPVLGARLLGEVEGAFPINDQPGHGVAGSHLGSAWEAGFYGIVQKDLRTVLGKPVAGPLNRTYCGNGSLAVCRAALKLSLRRALAVPPQAVYPADGVCTAGDQMCSDSIQFRAIGAITQPLLEWINRPTFQQADEIEGHRG